MSLTNYVVNERELIKLWSEVKFLPKYACNKCEKAKDKVVYMTNTINHFGGAFVCHGEKGTALYSVAGQDMFDPYRGTHNYGDMSEVILENE